MQPNEEPANHKPAVCPNGRENEQSIGAPATLDAPRAAAGVEPTQNAHICSISRALPEAFIGVVAP